MDFQEVVRRRRMVRNFTSEPVDPAVAERVLANAIRAPSAGFTQGWGFLLLDRIDDVARFWVATTPPETAAPGTATTPVAAEANPWLSGMHRAPVIIVALSNKSAYLDRYAEPDKGWTDRDEARWSAPYWDIDTGMATLLMLLTVTDEGLGSCFFGIPPEYIDPFRAEFGVPVEYVPIGAVAIGHQAPDRRSPSLRRGRRPVEEVVHRGQWRSE